MPTPVLLPIVVDASAPLTINAQIAEQIKLLIASEDLQSGDALPTVTQLAKYLGVNHNTIASVYNYLIESGYLVAQRGKGTFVANTQVVQNIITQKQFYSLLGQAFSAAAVAGLTPSEFAGTAYAQAVMLSHKNAVFLKIVFVNCAQHRLNVYEALQADIRLPVLFLSLEDIKADQAESIQELLSADLIITTAQNLWEVTQKTHPKQEVIGIDVQPDIHLLTRISSLPRNTTILLVCQEEAMGELMKQMLQQAGISHINFQSTGIENLQKNLAMAEQADVICASRFVVDLVRQYRSQSSEVLTFDFSLNEAHMSVLKARLAALQLAKQVASSYHKEEDFVEASAV